MMSENKRIMREIHNEQQDLTACADGQSVFHGFKNIDYLDDEARQLVWQIAAKKRTFFGVGFLDESIADLSEEDDDDLRSIINAYVKGFLKASIEYDETLHDKPINLLVEKLIETFAKVDGVILSDDSVLMSLLYPLIECESLAAWLTVCKISSN